MEIQGSFFVFDSNHKEKSKEGQILGNKPLVSLNIHYKHGSIIIVSDTWITLCSKLAGWRHSGTTEEKNKIKCYIIYIIN